MLHEIHTRKSHHFSYPLSVIRSITVSGTVLALRFWIVWALFESLFSIFKEVAAFFTQIFILWGMMIFAIKHQKPLQNL